MQLTLGTIFVYLPVAIIVNVVATHFSGWLARRYIANQYSVLTNSRTGSTTRTHSYLTGLTSVCNVFVNLAVAIVINTITYFLRRRARTAGFIDLAITVVINATANFSSWRDLLSPDRERS